MITALLLFSFFSFHSHTLELSFSAKVKRPMNTKVYNYTFNILLEPSNDSILLKKQINNEYQEEIHDFRSQGQIPIAMIPGHKSPFLYLSKWSDNQGQFRLEFPLDIMKSKWSYILIKFSGKDDPPILSVKESKLSYQCSEIHIPKRAMKTQKTLGFEFPIGIVPQRIDFLSCI